MGSIQDDNHIAVADCLGRGDRFWVPVPQMLQLLPKLKLKLE